MKLDFEKWIETQSPSVNVRNLFRESFLCYRIGAHRAALLYTYLGFLTVLKERLMISNKPPVVPEGMWTSLLQNIQRENRWEDSLYESTQNTAQAVFQIPEHVRLQIKYWKDRRNDSAHYKDNEINHHHVETLWSFIQSNLPKITVEGGKESLLNKFGIHFDSTRTRPGQNFSHLIQEIPFSVEPQEFSSFLTRLNEIISQLFFVSDNFLDVCEKCFAHLPNAYLERLVHYLKHKDDLYVSLIEQNPSLILRLDLDATEIRRLWSVKLRRTYSSLGVLAALLRNNLLPAEERDEAFKRFITISGYPPNDPVADEILWEQGFYEMVYDDYFERDGLLRWRSTNAKADLIMNYIEKRGFNDRMIERICEAFNKGLYSFSLANLLNRHFEERQPSKNSFIQSAVRLGLTLPRHLSSLVG